MSRLFTPSQGVNLLATELLRRPSKKELLIGQALSQRTTLTSTSLPLLVQQLLKAPSPLVGSDGRVSEAVAKSSTLDPKALYMASPRNRWELALGVLTSPTLKAGGVRPDVSLWGTVEASAPNAASKAACAEVLKALYRPKK